MELAEALSHHPFLPIFNSSSPVAILVGAAVPCQVEDEKALGEFICSNQSGGMRFSYPPSSPKPPPLCTARPPGGCAVNAGTGRWGQGGGRAPHGTSFLSQGEGILPSSSVAIRFSERSRNWR